MSQCMTCRYALYDGMCLAKGKFTALDAPACNTYAVRTDVEASRLKAENRELRQLVDYMTPIAWYAASERERDRMRELGIEVNE